MKPTVRVSNGVVYGTSGAVIGRTSEIAVGDRVEFVDPYPDENVFPMFVLEDRGDRVLVKYVTGRMTIEPTSDHLKSDLKLSTGR